LPFHLILFLPVGNVNFVLRFSIVLDPVVFSSWIAWKNNLNLDFFKTSSKQDYSSPLSYCFIPCCVFSGYSSYFSLLPDFSSLLSFKFLLVHVIIIPKHWYKIIICSPVFPCIC
jgi:hypothetical protein